jgi:hypothetical protein
MRPTTADAAAAAADPAHFEHLGWKFRHRAEFHDRAARYIVDGLAHNHWIEFVGRGSRERLWAELATLPGLADRLEAGGIGVAPASQFYALSADADVVDPHTAVALSVAALDRALQNGYAGFRVVVDATALARRPDQRDALSRFEFLLSCTMAGLPFSALCAYDAQQLATAADELICLHSNVSARPPRFRLHPAPPAAFALSGSIDLHSDNLYTTALQRIWPLIDDDPLIIDAHSLEFISHRQLHTLDHYARTDGRTVILRTGQRIPIRLGHVLHLTNVEVQPSPPRLAPVMSSAQLQTSYTASAG